MSTAADIALTIASPIVSKVVDNVAVFYPGLAVKKLRHFIKICVLTSEELKKQGIPPEEARQISDKLGLVFIPAASVEDSPELQVLFAKLLAHAMDPQFQLERLHIAFVECLKSMTPTDAHILQLFKDRPRLSYLQMGEALSKTAGDAGISLRNLMRLGFLDRYVIEDMPHVFTDPHFKYGYELTEFGSAFLQACTD